MRRGVAVEIMNSIGFGDLCRVYELENGIHELGKFSYDFTDLYFHVNLGCDSVNRVKWATNNPNH